MRGGGEEVCVLHTPGQEQVAQGQEVEEDHGYAQRRHRQPAEEGHRPVHRAAGGGQVRRLRPRGCWEEDIEKQIYPTQIQTQNVTNKTTQ